jgi:type I restriction enzyme M protein
MANTKERDLGNRAGNSQKSRIWDAACSIRGAKDAPKCKDYTLPLIFTRRFCDVFDDELNRIARKVSSRAQAFKLVERDKKPVRLYQPIKSENPDEPVWSVIRKPSDNIGKGLAAHLRGIAKGNPR